MNLSIGHLSTLIRRETGLSFSEYVTAKRMEDAKKLLCQENLSVEEVAEQVGYRDIAHFSSSFKRIVGVTPSEYQDRSLKR